jgi:hypothetical protein
VSRPKLAYLVLIARESRTLFNESATPKNFGQLWRIRQKWHSPRKKIFPFGKHFSAIRRELRTTPSLFQDDEEIARKMSG